MKKSAKQWKQNTRTCNFQMNKKTLAAARASQIAKKKKQIKNKYLFKSRQQYFKENPCILPQIPTIEADATKFASKQSTKLFIQQLQQRYSESYGAVKIIFKQNIFSLQNLNLIELINGHSSLGGSKFEYQQIGVGVFRKNQQKSSLTIPQELNKKSLTQNSFWQNISTIKSTHYGSIDVNRPEKFNQIFPSPVELFSSIFPHKSQQMVNQTLFGMKGSIFGFHMDYYNLVGINLIINGSQKQWYVIPGKKELEFRDFLLKQPRIPSQIGCARLHFTTIIDPVNLKDLGHSTLQKFGELMIIFSGSYHSGINLQTNLSAISSIATKKWLNQRNLPFCQCPYQLNKNMIQKMQIQANKNQIIFEEKFFKFYEQKDVFDLPLPFIHHSNDNDQQSRSKLIQLEVDKGIEQLNKAIGAQRKIKIREFKKIIGYNQDNFNGFCLFSTDPTVSYTKFIYCQFQPGQNIKVNLDKQFDTPLFITENYSNSERFADEDRFFNRQVRAQQSKNQIFEPKPKSNKCYVCRKIFSDYKKHVKSKKHKLNLAGYDIEGQIQFLRNRRNKK